MQVDDFDYDLPERLIAQSPLDKRDDSRLLVVDPQRVESFVQENQLAGDTRGFQSCWTHTFFRELPSFLREGDVLILNNSRVIPARLYGIKTDTKARVELLLTQAVSETEWFALAKPAKRLKVGTVLAFYGVESSATSPIGSAEVVDVLDDGIRRIRFTISEKMETFLDKAGTMPLPPYIHEPLQNPQRYQTVYSQPLGSVAAPTAGLHFTRELLEEVRARGVQIETVTLHVGIGTFRPVSVDTVEEHVMHKEWYEVPETTANAVNRARAQGRRVIAVGTTAMRTLESATSNGVTQAGGNETAIFIYPGYEFKAVNALITNFHLPKSTLLMLVSAFMGRDLTLSTYKEAVKEAYRFFSFGDAMFITGRGVKDEHATGAL